MAGGNLSKVQDMLVADVEDKDVAREAFVQIGEARLHQQPACHL
jgi:hypothetical protein